MTPQDQYNAKVRIIDAIVSGAIALAILTIIAVEEYSGRPVDQALASALGAIIGFYFGRSVAQVGRQNGGSQ